MCEGRRSAALLRPGGTHFLWRVGFWFSARAMRGSPGRHESFERRALVRVVQRDPEVLERFTADACQDRAVGEGRQHVIVCGVGTLDEPDRPDVEPGDANNRNLDGARV